MDILTNDVVGIASQIATVLSVVVAIFVAIFELRKYRVEREARVKQESEDRAKELDAKEREIEQLTRNSEINEFRFWLELRRMFWQHHDIHIKLRNGQKIDSEELPRIEAYMGLFELVYEMLEKGLINWPTFLRLYEYRINNIMKDPFVVKTKLIDNEEGWENFIALVKKLGYIKEGTRYIDTRPTIE
jgi:hypothetical protein